MIRSHRGDLYRAAALAAFVAIAWCVVHDRLTARSWQVPLFAKGDALTVFASFKSASEGFFVPLLPKSNPHLGAPLVANWNDFPITDELLVLFGGLLSRMLGLFAATNTLVLLAHVLAALSFFATCRVLDYRWQWSLAGGLAFGLSPYAFQRGIHHLTLTYYWHIPLGLLVCWWCMAPGGLELRSRRFAAALGVALVIGVHNPYYTNLFVQFLSFAALAQFLRASSWRRMAAPIVLGIASLCAFLAMNADTIYYQAVNGRNPGAIRRPYSDLERFALKPLDLFMPAPGHRLPAATRLARGYLRNPERMPYVQGEPFAQYLGLAGIGSLLWLAGVSVKRVLGRRRGPPLEALGILWVVLYSAVGGVNALLGQAGLTLFRCTNRYSIHILALSLLFAVRALSRLSASWRPAAATAALLVSAALISWDQLPPADTEASIGRIEAQLSSDREFTATMEGALPASAMVFQLPVSGFPESAQIEKMVDYDHLRPYLYSSDLRYSYGSVKGRGTESWQLPTSRLPVAEMVATLERYGFAAVYINRDGYADRGAALLGELRAVGRTDAIESRAGDLVCILLHPSPRPRLPGLEGRP